MSEYSILYFDFYNFPTILSYCTCIPKGFLLSTAVYLHLNCLFLFLFQNVLHSFGVFLFFSGSRELRYALVRGLAEQARCEFPKKLDMVNPSGGSIVRYWFNASIEYSVCSSWCSALYSYSLSCAVSVQNEAKLLAKT